MSATTGLSTITTKGGRGESVVHGSMLVIDPLGAFVCNITPVVLGIIIGQVQLVRWGEMIRLIPWLWWRTDDLYVVVYSVFVNALFRIAMHGDVRQYCEICKSGVFRSQEEWSNFLDMTCEPGRFMGHDSLPALIKHAEVRKHHLIVADYFD